MSETQTTPTQDKSSAIIKSTFLASLLSGAIGKTLFHPIDTIKAKLQVNSGTTLFKSISKKSAIIQLIQKTFNTQGIRGLYRGLPISVIGSIPATALYFTSYQYSKNFLLKYQYFRQNDFAAYLTSGMIAQIIACALFVPIDVIKQRLQVQAQLKSYHYTGDIDAIRSVFKTQGIRGMYRAYAATVLSFGPMSALYFTFYEKIKGLFVQNDAQTYVQRVAGDKQAEKKAEISGWKAMISSMLAGAIASSLTNPLDMGKLRLQVQRAGVNYESSTRFKYKHLPHAIWLIGKEEGVLALYNGMLVRILYHVPMVAFTMTFVQVFKVKIRKWLQNQ